MEEKEIEQVVEFFYNRCLRCDYKDCIKKSEHIEELENALLKLKNEKLNKISELTNIKF